VIGAQTKEEAEQILKEIKTRLKKFNLEISAEKTKIVEFGRYAKNNANNRGKKKPDTFDFLGFTHYVSVSRKGNFLMKVRTNKERRSESLKHINEWLKRIRNRQKAKDIWKVLSAKLRGHYNYYGVSGNSRELQNYYHQTIKLTYKWMNRRSQKQSFNWTTFTEYLKLYPLPKPILVHNMYDIW